jgi:DNA repair protein RecN (Recombination protein N)
MLSYLRVQNLGILEDAEIEPGEGLTVITGETGTGKTLLLGALRLLTGDKPETGRVGPFAPEARVDGVFLKGEEEVGVSRHVPANGRSRAYLDAKVVSASALGDEIGPMVELTGQHEHLRLASQPVLLDMIDSMVGRGDPKPLEEYRGSWERLREVEKRHESLGGDQMALERELDLLGHQVAEIEAAGLDGMNDGSVESLASRLRNLELLQAEVASALADIEVMVDRSGAVVASTRRLAATDEGFRDVNDTAEALAGELGELFRTVADLRAELAEAEEERTGLEERLNVIGDLKRKYGRTVAEVLEFGAEAAARILDLTRLVAAAGTIGEDLERARNENLETAGALSGVRAEVSTRIARDALSHLADLGLERAILRFEIEETAPGRSGKDRISLQFASDDRLEPGPIGDVASGGELSRLILALRLASNSGTASTLVFDEADAGIGGMTALALGEKLADLAVRDQVIVVTHLPQVAAHAEVHLVVDREDDRAVVRRVEGDDRVIELSRMLAGLPDSQGGRDAAAELLETARR